LKFNTFNYDYKKQKKKKIAMSGSEEQANAVSFKTHQSKELK
jgi:hypothetical protein